MRSVELLRHTDNDGDRLSPEGIAAAEAIGRETLTPPYAVFGSTGAGRATEMVEILRRIVGQDDVPITEVRGLRSSVEDRWRAAAKVAGKGADVEAIRAVDPDLVERESGLLGRALRGVFDALPDGGRALVVGHSPTNEAAVLGLAGTVVGPLGKGEGVLVVEDSGRFEVRPRVEAQMADGKGREGYHDPFAGIGGAPPTRSALTLRIVLATFGLVVCATGAMALWIADAPAALPAIAAMFALVALVDLGVVIRRKLSGEPG